MDNVSDLKKIKKEYNEKFAQLCAGLFPTLLETPGLLYEVISNTFAPSRFLYEDIIDANAQDGIKSIVLNRIKQEKQKNIDTSKTPEELLDEAGYILYKCETEEDIQKFRHYWYRPGGTPIYKSGETPTRHFGEELCTFDGGRLDRCHVFFAIKKNIDEIKREDFTNPQRQDLYGTSAISIQFDRYDSSRVSIKNRYNHTVLNPDATFSNNLDNIIPGLANAFNKKYGFHARAEDSDLPLPNYVCADDGRFYRFNYEENGIYYCPNNVIIDNFRVKKFDKAKYIVLDTFVLSLTKEEGERRIIDYDSNIYDSFANTIYDKDQGIEIEKIVVDKNEDSRKITINDNIVIELDKYNRIISYTNPVVKEIPPYFMQKNDTLRKIDLRNVEIIGDYFLYENVIVTNTNFENLRETGDYFLPHATGIMTLNLPNIEKFGNNCLERCYRLEYFNAPKLKIVGDYFLENNNRITFLYLNELEEVGDNFLFDNTCLNSLTANRLKIAGTNFLYSNKCLDTLTLNNLFIAKGSFMHENNRLKYFTAKNLGRFGDRFLENNTVLESIDTPNLCDENRNYLNQKFKLVKKIPEIKTSKKIIDIYREVSDGLAKGKSMWHR